MNARDLSLSVVEALMRPHTEAGQREVFPITEGHSSARPPFSIAISREVGALGNRVAAEVGKRLGWPVYDREVLDKIAQELRRPPSQLRTVDERPVTWLEECLSGLLNEYHVSSDAYFKYLIGAVRGMGAAGRCVIVGRGANFILPPDTTLRVRLVADLKDRVNVIAHRLGLSEHDAAVFVETTERERVLFVKRYFMNDPTVPLHYDLVLNTSRLSPDEAADIIIAALRRFEERAPRAGRKPAPAAAQSRN